MNIECINTKEAPQAIGPYSQAVKAGGFIYLSGQIPIDHVTGEVQLFSGDAAAQARLVLKNLKAILESQGLTTSNIVKTTIFLKDLKSFATVNEVYREFFKEHEPARACVEVSRLPKEVDVEIEAIAYAG